MLLLERDKQLALLGRWQEATATRGGCVALVTGEAGIGKTAVVSEFVRRRGPALRVLWGSCDPLSTPQPLGPLRDVGRHVGGALLDAVTQGTNRERIFAAVIDELERPGKPVVFVIEDMHWADDATLDLMKYLGRRIARTRAMLIVTYRSEELHARHPLQSSIGLLPGETVRRLPLTALSEDAIGALAQTLGRSSQGLFAATGGNPFYVTELLAAPPGEVPTSVRDTVIARVARLSPDARQVAELVAAVPGHAEPWLIASVLQAMDGAIEECLRSGLSRNQDESLRFRHELARLAVEESLTPAQARTLHAHILRALRSRAQGEVVESRLVHHAVRAADVAAILELAPQAAGRAASVGAHREAAAYYRRALRHEEHLTPPARAALHDSFAYESFLTGEIEAAIDSRTSALALWRASGDASRAGCTLRWLSRLTWFRGHGEQARRYAMESVATLEPLGPSKELAMAFSNLSQLSMLASDEQGSVAWGERAMELARELGNDEILSHALNNVGTARARAVGDRGWKDLERSLELSLRCGVHEHVARTYTNLATMAVYTRNHQVGANYIATGLSFCVEHELYTAEAYLRAFRARLNLERGAWTEALEEAEGLLRQGELSIAARIPALTVVGTIRSRRGSEDALQLFDEALELALGTAEPQRVIPVAAARAEHAWLHGDHVAVGEELRRAQPFALRDHLDWRSGELAFWCWRAGVLADSAIKPAAPHQLQMSGDCLAAAAAWGALDCPYEEALALADSPDPEARKRALQIFDKLGARPMSNRLRRQLKSEGVKGLKRGANRSTRANAAGLTVREVEVLTLVTQNLSNAAIARRLYVSPKTVDHHASAILTKLGIASRREAAAAARRLGIELVEPRRSRA
jgi:ATP/maltotriose-dependent transcriptional regulator MalT